jgi:predicted phage gp36 major capsid-like protein
MAPTSRWVSSLPAPTASAPAATWSTGSTTFIAHVDDPADCLIDALYTLKAQYQAKASGYSIAPS